MIFRFIAAILVATWLIWQVPFASTDEIRLPEIVAFSAFNDEIPTTGESPAMIFYRRSDVGQYTAYGVGAAGNVVRSIRLPGSELKKADETKIALAGKEGYITAPENGAYYIWYPQIGTQVYVFNEQGSFLWEKEESHYLNALPRGRYILAAAGDHSRMLFMNPDFKVHADFQGVLFTRFIADDNPELKAAQVCIGSLDGEIVVAHLDRKLYFRHKLGYALKSLHCDFERGELVAIVERSVEVEKAVAQRDFLLRMAFNLQAPKDEKATEAMRMVPVELDTIQSVELTVRTVTASPLVLAGESVCFLQAAAPAEAADGLALYYTTGRKSALRQMIVAPVAAADMAPDLWRGAVLRIGKEQACLFTHRSGRFLIANRRGLLLERNDLPAERMMSRGDMAYLQTASGIITFR